MAKYMCRIFERIIQVSADYELLRNLILQANFGYENDIFDGTNRTDHITSFGLGAKYLLDRRISLYAHYDHSGRYSTFGGSNFGDNLLTAGITLQY